jgi:hypothetical protein
MENRKYPIGIQDFEVIRKDGYVYIDKTKLMFQMVSTRKYYFLNRPRRFGKSLLVNTLKAYFEGKRELFRGLAIERLETKWEQHPVLHFDFSTGKFETREMLQQAIDYKLSDLEKPYGIPQDGLNASIRMTRLIKTAYEQTGHQVVILVDEYDSAMLQHIEDQEQQDGVRMEMRNLFSPIKEADPWLCFVLLTGITKFSQMSIFSELNNLENISMVPQYDTICGISEEELVTKLCPDVEKLADSYEIDYNDMLQELKDMYDGYHFSEKKTDMYNPYSLLNAFKSQKIASYWFGTATPTFLTKILHKYEITLDYLSDIRCTASGFDQPIEHVSDPVPVLYQSGYLTIKDYQRFGEVYQLGFPNREVRVGFADSLYRFYAQNDVRSKEELYLSYLDFYRNNNLASFMEAVKTFFAGTTYQLNNNNERHYQALFYTLLVAFGADVAPEVASAKGRADIVLKMPTTIYIFELKLDKTATEALAQINERSYAAPYVNDGRHLVKVGVNFSSVERTIQEWRSEA